MKMSSLVLIGSAVALAPLAADASITVEFNLLASLARDGAGVGDSWSGFGPTDPTDSTPYNFESVEGDSYAKSTVQWTQSNGQTIFTLDSELKRSGAHNSVAYANAFSLQFTANENTSFEFSGYLDVTDVGAAESGLVELHAYMFGGTEGFFSDQISLHTHNERLVLGEAGGDTFNEGMSGSGFNGTLESGREYSLFFFSYINAPIADSGATAVSNFTLKIGTIPEPSTIALFSIFAALGLVRLRRPPQPRCG